MMKKVLLLLAALSLMAAGMTSATASHPTQMCLDIDPDRASPTSNDDIIDSIWAYPGATDAGHPPQYEGCVTERTGPDQDWSGTQIDFEITGVADPDDSDSPESPDLTCTVGKGGGGCAVHPPSSGGGEQTIRAWIDIDQDDDTLDGVDLSEGHDEDTDGGTYGEPDLTDVALWTWTHGDPPPCGDGECGGPTSVTIDHRDRGGAFHGRVESTRRECESDRVVKLWKVKRGPDRLLDRTRSDVDGRWQIGGFGNARGRYYTTVTRARVAMEDTTFPATITCGTARSETLRIR